MSIDYTLGRQFELASRPVRVVYLLVISREGYVREFYSRFSRFTSVVTFTLYCGLIPFCSDLLSAVSSKGFSHCSRSCSCSPIDDTFICYFNVVGSFASCSCKLFCAHWWVFAADKSKYCVYWFQYRCFLQALCPVWSSSDSDDSDDDDDDCESSQACTCVIQWRLLVQKWALHRERGSSVARVHLIKWVYSTILCWGPQ